MTAPNFNKEPWKHPAVWKGHVVRTTLAHDAGVDHAIGSCECGWCVCSRIDRAGSALALVEAREEHWLSVIAEAEAVAA